MSFTIKLQKNNSPLNKVDKSITDVITMTGTLRNESETVNPVILFETSEFPVVNYLTIDAFHRSYFIEDILSIRNNIWEVHAHSDPLYSFRSELRNNQALLLRQENLFNLYLNDGVFKCKQNSRVRYKLFPGGFTDFNYILITAGGSSS